MNDALKNPCLTCRFAEWRRTTTGRLHPSGDGRCGWKMPTIALPKAFYFIGRNTGLVPQPSGGNIERRDDARPCPTYEASND